MAKAKDDHTPELPPLDDDANWMPLPEAIQLRGRQTGDIGLAGLDLEQSQAREQVRSMRRHRRTGDREHVPSSDWKTYFISYIGASSVMVSRQTDIDRHKTDDYGNLVAEPVDGLFYVWKPDFDRIWPVIQPATAQRQEAHTPAAGAPPKFTADQQQWLREKYSSDLVTTPRLAKHDGAVAHVKDLAKTQFRIEAGRNTLLKQVIRPVLAAKKSQ
jgi:hypothetical protein